MTKLDPLPTTGHSGPDDDIEPFEDELYEEEWLSGPPRRPARLLSITSPSSHQACDTCSPSGPSAYEKDRLNFDLFCGTHAPAGTRSTWGSTWTISRWPAAPKWVRDGKGGDRVNWVAVPFAHLEATCPVRRTIR